jgi:DNA gyrase subunit A
MALLEIDEVQATAILDMQLRRLAALERQKLIDEHDEIEAEIADYKDILAKPGAAAADHRDELGEIVEQVRRRAAHRDHPYDGDVSIEDLIADEDVVVTITAPVTPSAPRPTCTGPRSAAARACSGAALRTDDIVEHFFVSSTHDWILFFTNKGRVYRAKAYELPGGQPQRPRPARRQPAGLPARRAIAEVIALKNYEVAPYLVLATKSGLVKKSKLTDFDSNRSGGHHRDQPARGRRTHRGAALVSSDDDLLLVSKRAQSIRFHASDETLRPMGRATSGVIGMRSTTATSCSTCTWSGDDDDAGGHRRRLRQAHPDDQYPLRGRGGLGVITARIVEDRGGLVGALMVRPEDEVFAITSAGGVIRTRAGEVKQSGRQTMGVRLMNLASGTSVVALARNAESEAVDEPVDDEPMWMNLWTSLWMRLWRTPRTSPRRTIPVTNERLKQLTGG